MNNNNICLTDENLNFRSKLCQYPYYYIQNISKNYIKLSLYLTINFLEH